VFIFFTKTTHDSNCMHVAFGDDISKSSTQWAMRTNGLGDFSALYSLASLSFYFFVYPKTRSSFLVITNCTNSSWPILALNELPFCFIFISVFRWYFYLEYFAPPCRRLVYVFRHQPYRCSFQTPTIEIRELFAVRRNPLGRLYMSQEIVLNAGGVGMRRMSMNI
jgi:hypothetical protein